MQLSEPLFPAPDDDAFILVFHYKLFSLLTDAEFLLFLFDLWRLCVLLVQIEVPLLLPDLLASQIFLLLALHVDVGLEEQSKKKKIRQVKVQPQSAGLYTVSMLLTYVREVCTNVSEAPCDSLSFLESLINSLYNYYFEDKFLLSQRYYDLFKNKQRQLHDLNSMFR